MAEFSRIRTRGLIVKPAALLLRWTSCVKCRRRRLSVIVRMPGASVAAVRVLAVPLRPPSSLVSTALVKLAAVAVAAASKKVLTVARTQRQAKPFRFLGRSLIGSFTRRGHSGVVCGARRSQSASPRAPGSLRSARRRHGREGHLQPAAQRRSSAAEEWGSSSSYSSSSDGFVALEHGLSGGSLSEPLDSALAVTHDRRRSGEGSDDVDDVDEHDGNDNNDNDDDEGGDGELEKSPRSCCLSLDHFGFAGVLPVSKSGGTQAECFSRSWSTRRRLTRTSLANQILALPVREVHKIGILDLRLFNEDRHGGNLLLDFGGQSTSSSTSVTSPSSPSGSGSPRIVPIDHEDTSQIGGSVMRRFAGIIGRSRKNPSTTRLCRTFAVSARPAMRRF